MKLISLIIFSLSSIHTFAAEDVAARLKENCIHEMASQEFGDQPARRLDFANPFKITSNFYWSIDNKVVIRGENGGAAIPVWDPKLYATTKNGKLKISSRGGKTISDAEEASIKDWYLRASTATNWAIRPQSKIPKSQAIGLARVFESCKEVKGFQLKKNLDLATASRNILARIYKEFPEVFKATEKGSKSAVTR